LCAPTGKAACNIGGVTLHSTLCIFSGNRDKQLKGMQLQSLQEKFKSIKYLIVDEYSMVGCKMLSVIDDRLRQIKCKPTTLFGGLSVLLVGDSKQLPPVLDTPLWNNTSKSNDVKVKQGLAAFSCFESVVVLDEIVRQEGADQVRFRDLLNRLRLGQATEADYDLLKPRINGLAKHEQRFQTALYLMYTKEEVRAFNEKQLETLAAKGHRTCRINGLHNNKEAQRQSSDSMMGLSSDLSLAEGARVMITSNLWTQVGLTNGATGTVRHIIFKKDVCPPNLPIAVVVEMDEGYKGPCLPGLPRHVVINPKTASTQSVSGGYLERIQFPLRLAFAITIHKCQGI
jgi:ATP-dependent exoDNAse (exonuclease V) alpha subunit